MELLFLRQDGVSKMGSDNTLIRSSADTSDVTTSDQDQHLSRLGEAFQFSRWFILTYQATLVCVVLAISLCRWTESRARRRRTRAGRVKKRVDEIGYGTVKGGEQYRGHASASPSSSTSGTIGGTNTPPSLAKREDGWTRLLDPEGKTESQRGRRWNPWPRFRSMTMYQPSPIPGIDKVLPPTETILWILSLWALNLFYLLYNLLPLDAEAPTILSDRAGLLFVANLPWLYLLAAKNQPIKRLTGDSYENLNMLHRRLGEWMCFLAAIHLAGMLSAWFTFLRPAGLGLYSFLTIGYIFFGCLAWVCYEVLYLTSLGSFRERWYEVFLDSHVLLQAGALGFLFLHHYASRPYVGVALLVFLLDRLIWRLGLKTCTVRADLQVMDDGETVSVAADWTLLRREESSWWRKLLGYDMRFGWKPSEHVFLTVAGISPKHRFQFHPRTIASAAPASGQTHAWFNLIIRAKTGFSRDLLLYAQNNPSTMIKLDGPYGSLHALQMLQSSDVAIIVAGGSGIAVAYPLLWDLLRRRNREQRVCLIWIVQESSHISWIGRERLEELRELGLHLVIPGPSREAGRPDARSILTEVVENEEKAAGVGVVVSGPDGLNRTVQNTCAAMVRCGRKVEVAVEKFGW